MPTPSFVGRAAELERIATSFEASRLATLLGPGGMGKTRLALRHAESRLASLAMPGRGGVWFVDLSEARSAQDALTSLAAALSIALVGRATERAMSEHVGREIANLGPSLVVAGAAELLVIGLAGAPLGELLRASLRAHVASVATVERRRGRTCPRTFRRTCSARAFSP